MAKIIATIVGGALCALGMVSFFAPGMFGCHGSALSSLLRVVAGGVVVYAAQRMGVATALQVYVAAGIIATALGLAGLMLGTPGEATVLAMPPDSRLLVVIPRMLEFGRNDHVLHLVFGVGFGLAVVAALAETPLRLRR